jgi:hypothetical protein
MRRSSGIGKLVRLAIWGLAIGALVQELKKPAGEREWTGTVAGVVPYDYRLPTASRIRDRLWNPDGPLVSPQVFGVGWSLNFGRVLAMLRGSSG